MWSWVAVHWRMWLACIWRPVAMPSSLRRRSAKASSSFGCVLYVQSHVTSWRVSPLRLQCLGGQAPSDQQARARPSACYVRKLFRASVGEFRGLTMNLALGTYSRRRASSKALPASGGWSSAAEMPSTHHAGRYRFNAPILNSPQLWIWGQLFFQDPCLW